MCCPVAAIALSSYFTDWSSAGYTKPGAPTEFLQKNKKKQNKTNKQKTNTRETL